MRCVIDLYKITRPPMIAVETIIGVLVLVQLFSTIGLLFAVPFAALTVLGAHFLYGFILFPYGSLKTVYEFTPDTLTQSRKDKVEKTISMGYGLHVYRSVGLTRSYLVFSRVEFSPADPLGKAQKCADAVVIPYYPRKMPKLERFYKKAVKI